MTQPRTQKLFRVMCLERMLRGTARWYVQGRDSKEPVGESFFTTKREAEMYAIRLALEYQE